ncbi:MAG TPA: hypothetical protein VMV92_19610 [Streptosporangiaceae bacterium]|nr:hypothetical protein [Streptosporangiaceae bacterium]
MYRGVMHGPGQQEMYSFVPARADGQPFARPTIRLDGLVNPALGRGTKTTTLSAVQALEVWREVIEQVRQEHQLDLAVFLTEPQIMPGQAVLDAGEGGSCTDRPTPADRRRGC